MPPSAACSPVRSDSRKRCCAHLRALDAQGQLLVKRVDVDRLIDEVSSVAPDPNTFAQARHVRAATDPAAVLQECAQVYWWDVAPPARDIGYPWSRKELSWLREHGVALFEVDQVLRNRTRRWLRPILNARERLMFAVHDSEKGYHPLWTQISNAFDGLFEVRIDDSLLNGSAPASAIGIATRPLPVRTLTSAKRWWQLPNDIEIPRRSVESYSSLSKLFDWPHGYVLRYAANLRPGRAQDIADGNRLYGNLAHRLFERYFNENLLWALLDAEGRRAWFAKELPALIETEAALLLEPGRGVEKQRVSTTLERALVSLIDHLKSANVVSVQPELHAEAPFKSIRIGGDIDLLLTDPRGREIVLDIKWGAEKFRGDQLRANRHVQLAAYAYLAAHEAVSVSGVLHHRVGSHPGAGRERLPGRDGLRGGEWRVSRGPVETRRGQLRLALEATRQRPHRGERRVYATDRRIESAGDGAGCVRRSRPIRRLRQSDRLGRLSMRQR